jgi:hypothetical protein
MCVLNLHTYLPGSKSLSSNCYATITMFYFKAEQYYLIHSKFLFVQILGAK